jgi:hypothetical protein
MSELSRTMQDLPLAGLIPAGLLLVLGLMLWIAGQRVLRPVFALAGLVVGAGAGWLAAAAFVRHEIDIGLPPWLGAVILGLLFAAVGALVYRLAVAFALAVVLALAGAAAVLTVNEIDIVPSWSQDATPAPAEDPGAPVFSLPGPIEDLANDWLRRTATGDTGETDAGDLARGDDEPTTLERVAGANERLGEAEDLAEQVLAIAAEWWQQVPAPVRPVLVGAALAGLLAGLLLATFAQRLSVTTVTAFGGSLLWIGSLGVLASRFGVDLKALVADSPGVTLVLWLIVSLIGVAIQWTTRARPADTSG